jgi:NAD-dependent dihydropyrimidine dehydrogenase PreA subunit
MKREIININDDLCNGCGKCIPGCAEGALQMIDGKARLVSDLMCDGLGACIGHCPEGAITIEEREAAPYDEVLVMKEMIRKGKNTVKAHLQHLLDHQQDEFVKQGIDYLKASQGELDFMLEEVIPYDNQKEHKETIQKTQIETEHHHHSHVGSACPGLAMREMKRNSTSKDEKPMNFTESSLEHWPVQLHLANPNAPYFMHSDLLIAADCTAFSMGDFHQRLLNGKKLVIACPKLDTNQQSYLDKLSGIIRYGNLNTITIAVMEVPCCSGLTQLVLRAVQISKKRLPVKQVVVGIDGEIRSEDWVNM